jgi:hypothetical protein
MLVDKNRTPTDTSRVNLGEEWEVRWWCDRFGCTEVALRTAVGKVGPSADSVERQLKEAAKAAFKNTGED